MNEDNAVAILLGLLALAGSAVTAFLGLRQRRDVSGDKAVDEEQQIRSELRAENKELKAEVKQLHTITDQLTVENKQLRSQNEALTQTVADQEQHLAALQEDLRLRAAEIDRLRSDVVRLTREVSDLRRRLPGWDGRTERRRPDVQRGSGGEDGDGRSK